MKRFRMLDDELFQQIIEALGEAATLAPGSEDTAMIALEALRAKFPPDERLDITDPPF